MTVSGEGTAATEDMKSIRDWCSRGRTITDGISTRETRCGGCGDLGAPLPTDVWRWWRGVVGAAGKGGRGGRQRCVG
jgi:hypothetical protein